MNPIILGLDIGGANLKACDSTGRAEVVAFELFRHPERLADEVRKLASRMATPNAVVVTMTAELCDCFETLREGVLKIVAALESIYQPGILRIWGVDGAFHTTTTIRNEPSLAFASNWRALGDCMAAEHFGDSSGLVIDIGSTTTDILAVSKGRLISESRTDLDRLQSNELVYLGTSRTPLCSVISDFKFRGRKTPVMRELFATTGDVYWTLGELAESSEFTGTANGKPGTRGEARHRLARMLGLDFEHFTEADATELATQADKQIVRILEKAVATVSGFLPASRPERIVVSGSGAFLARKIAEKVVPIERVVDLESIWGPEKAGAACAVALVRLAAEKFQA
jgi:probable H4MPT-linked C1 transfer pathway protein